MLILQLSASVDRLNFTEVMKEEQVLLDKTNTDLKIDFKMAGYKNNMEKDATLSILHLMS